MLGILGVAIAVPLVVLLIVEWHVVVVQTVGLCSLALAAVGVLALTEVYVAREQCCNSTVSATVEYLWRWLGCVSGVILLLFCKRGAASAVLLLRLDCTEL